MAANYSQVVQINILRVRGERVDEVGRKMGEREGDREEREKTIEQVGKMLAISEVG